MGIYEKPQAAKKFRRLFKDVGENNGRMGTSVRAIHFNYNNMCNFKCEFCYTKSPALPNPKVEMSFEKIADFADQAHELGYYEFDLQGGELLLRPDRLYKLIAALKPERFFVIMTTNGYFVTQEIAHKLKKAGMDRLSISITGLDAELNDKFMKKKGAHQKALDAMVYGKNAGMLVVPTIAVGHYNAQSEGLERFCEFCAEKGYVTHFNLAMPSGDWQQNLDILIDEKDRERINELRKKFKNIIYDMWNPFDKNREGLLGCNCVNRLYVTPKGDIFPCPFLHIKLGNIYEQSLKEIQAYGFSIKYFRDFQGKCLAGEDREFIKKYLSRERTIFEPLDAREIFTAEDYVDGKSDPEPKKEGVISA